MREFVEFRVPEEVASLLFEDSEGTRLGGSVRKVVLETNDPRFLEVGRLQHEFRASRNERFFYGWEFDRRYSADELTEAECLQLIVTSAFEPAGEECGTEYDESGACPQCGIGAVQGHPLRLDLRKAPKSRDIARTIADEWIVSQRLAEQIWGANVSGIELQAVRHRANNSADPIDLHSTPTGRSLLVAADAAGAPHGTWAFFVWLNKAENADALSAAKKESDILNKRRDAWRPPPPQWYQLVVLDSTPRIVAPTRAGSDPFDHHGEGSCTCTSGDLIGLNLLSELSVERASRGSADLVCSRQFIGVRRGLLRPQRPILTSPKLYRLFKSLDAKGAKFEVVHLL